MDLNTLLQWGSVIAILLIVITLAVIRIVRLIRSMRSSSSPQCSCGCDGCSQKCDLRKPSADNLRKPDGRKP